MGEGQLLTHVESEGVLTAVQGSKVLYAVWRSRGS
jgi:hypothetical protein